MLRRLLRRGGFWCLGLRSAFRLSPRNFYICHLQIGKRVGQHCCLFAGQVTARFFLNHGELIDEHSGQIEVHFGFAALWIRDLAKKQRGVLRVQSNE